MNSLEELLGRVEGDWLIGVLEDDRLYDVYQPIVLAEDPEGIHGFECLLRGRNESGNTINPSRIFGTARNSDMLFQLDREARIQAVRNGSKLPVNKKIFINFMPTSIYDPEYCLRTTMEAVKDYEVRKDQLVFEVVETEQVGDRENLVDILDCYRDKGVNITLDDFGARYSSLSLLKDLNPAYIKLDLELVQSVTENELSAQLAKNIIGTSKDHGIVTLAEGIETTEQLEWLQEHGTDYLQGYLFSEPVDEPMTQLDGAQ